MKREGNALALNLIELLTAPDGQPFLDSSDVEFRSSNNDLMGKMARMSEPTSCRHMVFIELPAGFQSTTRVPDCDQIAVVLSGRLRIVATEGAVRSVQAGEVFRLPQAETSSHTLEVVGQETVTIMVVQA